MDALVGSTGFVGSNIAAGHNFGAMYNSKNIRAAFGTRPELLVYAGVPAEMFLANSDPAADLAIIMDAAENIRQIAPGRLVLISTIAVLDEPSGAYEDHEIDTKRLTAYGAHRQRLELMALECVRKCHILRLPALFGKGIKKNFIYDMMNFVPAMLNKSRFDLFSGRETIISDCYRLQDNGFYKLSVEGDRKNELRGAFERLDFSALNFTDSRSVFQFYDLKYIWDHIKIALANDISLLHVSTEPLSAGEVFEEIYGKKFKNELPAAPFNYDFRTRYAACFGSASDYIFNREQVLDDLKSFVGVK